MQTKNTSAIATNLQAETDRRLGMDTSFSIRLLDGRRKRPKNIDLPRLAQVEPSGLDTRVSTPAVSGMGSSLAANQSTQVPPS
jgi:hypothetical protein